MLPPPPPAPAAPPATAAAAPPAEAPAPPWGAAPCFTAPAAPAAPAAPPRRSNRSCRRRPPLLGCKLLQLLLGHVEAALGELLGPLHGLPQRLALHPELPVDLTDARVVLGDVGDDARLEVAEREEAVVVAHLDGVHRLLEQNHLPPLLVGVDAQVLRHDVVLVGLELVVAHVVPRLLQLRHVRGVHVLVVRLRRHQLLPPLLPLLPQNLAHLGLGHALRNPGTQSTRVSCRQPARGAHVGL